MTRRWLIGSGVAAAMAAVLAFVGFLKGGMSWGIISSAGGTLDTGRSVTAYSDCIYLTTRTGGDTATIETAGKTIIVKPTAVFVDGTNFATIDEKVSKVEVHVTHGLISLLADGKTVTPTTR